MRKGISVVCVCLMSLLLAVGTLTTCAVTPLDTEAPCSLTLHYTHGESAFGGLQIRIYRVAEAFADGTYALCGAFAEYPVDIYGIESQTEWKAISSTLAAYAVADDVAPTAAALTDETGTVAFTELSTGMYLTEAVRVESDTEITVFESFMMAVPMRNEQDVYLYDVTAYPKRTEYTPKPVEIEHRVVKQWRDTGYVDRRPAYVDVDIFKDGVLTETQRLSSENNWSYGWTAQDDGGKWQAVERGIPADYAVTVAEDGNVIIITNTFTMADTSSPDTGDTTVLWPYLLAACFSGGMMILLSTWRRRTAK